MIMSAFAHRQGETRVPISNTVAVASSLSRIDWQYKVDWDRSQPRVPYNKFHLSGLLQTMKRPETPCKRQTTSREPPTLTNGRPGQCN